MSARKNSSLHGNVPDTAPWVLLIVDVFNEFQFPGGRKLKSQAMRVAKRIAELRAAFRRARYPVVFVNDNIGKWTGNFDDVVSHCREEFCLGSEIAELLLPQAGDYR